MDNQTLKFKQHGSAFQLKLQTDKIGRNEQNYKTLFLLKSFYEVISIRAKLPRLLEKKLDKLNILVISANIFICMQVLIELPEHLLEYEWLI